MSCAHRSSFLPAAVIRVVPETSSDTLLTGLVLLLLKAAIITLLFAWFRWHFPPILALRAGPFCVPCRLRGIVAARRAGRKWPIRGGLTNSYYANSSRSAFVSFRSSENSELPAPCEAASASAVAAD
jgi:hypothetical protein